MGDTIFEHCFKGGSDIEFFVLISDIANNDIL